MMLDLPHIKPFSIFLLVLSTVSILLWSLLTWDFILDDAYITYRYSLNLLEHGSLSWNVGQNPVEAYTSFFWVLTVCAGLLMGLESTTFASLFSLFTVLVVSASLIVKTKNLPFYERIGILAPVAFSPVMILHATQGMETAFTAAVLYFTSIYIIRINTSQYIHPKDTLIMYLGMLVLATLRPETVVFSAGAWVCIVTDKLFENKQLVKKLVIYSIPFVVCGVIYMIWRIQYFGYILPNPAYIKEGGGINAGALLQLRDYIVWMIGPFGLYVVWGVGANLKWKNVKALAPVIVGCLAILLYFMTVKHIQAYLFRYPIITVPAIMLVMATLLEKSQDNKEYKYKSPVLGVIISILLIVWHAAPVYEVVREMNARTDADRVAAGKALKGLDGTMFVSESGALPFYSDWESYDLLGLTSEKIAHEGMECELLAEWDPDLIVILSGEILSPKNHRWQSIKCIQPNQWEVAAVTKKTGNSRHIFFVKKESHIYEETRRRIANIEGVEYADPKVVMAAIEGF